MDGATTTQRQWRTARWQWDSNYGNEDGRCNNTVMATAMEGATARRQQWWTAQQDDNGGDCPHNDEGILRRYSKEMGDSIHAVAMSMVDAMATQWATVMVAATGTATATVAMVGTITIAIVPTAMVIECAIAWLLSQQRRKVNDGNGNGRRNDMATWKVLRWCDGHQGW